MDLHYKQYGTGAPLVILHGLLGAGGNWHTLSDKVFSEAFSVYALDQRNHGRSPHHDVIDYASMAEDLRAFQERHGLGPLHLMGHSMGGKTAMHFALRYPEQVARLIVVDMAPRAYPPNHDAILHAMGAVDFAVYTTRQQVDDALARYIRSYPVRQFLLKNLTYDQESERYAWQVNLEAITKHYGRLNEAVTAEAPYDGPALFVRGAQSDYVTDDDRDEIRRLFPRAEVATVPDAGHWVHADAPEAFARVVMDFLTTPAEAAGQS